MVATAALGLCLGAAPIIVYSFAIFFKPLSQEYHAGRAAISFAFTLQNVAAALFAPLTGRLIDRFGARNVILPGTAIFGLLLVSSVLLGSKVWCLYAFFAVLGIVQGCTSPVGYSVVVSHWFNRRRGFGLGLMMLGIGVGAIVAPSFAQRLIAMFGWRAAYAIWGCAALLIALPMVAAFLRNDPKDKGLLPDGDAEPAESGRHTIEPRTSAEGLSWPQIWHSSTFWLLVSSFFLAGASVHACVLHLAALLTDRGVSAQAAAVAVSVVGLAVLIGRVVTGYLLDKFFAPRLAAFFFFGAATGIGLLILGAAGKIALGAAFLIGMGMGAEGDVIAYSISRYFGLKAFGTAYGYAFGAFVLAGAAGTLLMGVGFDFTRSYTVPLAGFFVAMLTAAGLLLLLGPYRYAASQTHEKPPATPAREASLG
ncbi:MAG TPA: MFS transporter [Candidatus Acidoferrum sp.]|nr:MFS transporter [Candidatus Acidoferrum sp.]